MLDGKTTENKQKNIGRETNCYLPGGLMMYSLPDGNVGGQTFVIVKNKCSDQIIPSRLSCYYVGLHQ